ncbi:MAG: SAM-dependent methyltransferase [Parcubacteria group bacterium GW2011_GWD2_38_11]|nr:MAG: SAM-dependent methyltransferase [Parcubacteria group bacterium GW2011_GWD2_38_11]
MKIKLFSFAKNILSLFNVSIKTEWRAFALANLLFGILPNIFKFSFRDDMDFERARDFLFYFGKEEKIKQLKENLDDESQELIDRLLERQKYIYTNNILNNEYFSKEEIRQQDDIDLSGYKKLYPMLNSFPVETFFYHNGLNFVPRERAEKMKGGDVIDAGAFIGDSAIVFSGEYSFNKIYSFEPQKNNYENLKKVIGEYRLNNVVAVNNGLGDEKASLQIKSEGLMATITDGGDGENIEVITIDEFAGENKLKIGLIKMDIEGAEYKSIIGAKKTIQEQKPVLLISIYHRAQDFYEIKPFVANLNPEYKFMIRKINPFSLANETILIAY